MRRGEIWLVDLEPVRGSEASKRRPAVIVSNEGANAAAVRRGEGVVTVVPMTSNIARIFPFQVSMNASETGLEHDTKAQAEQVRSVDARRLQHRLGSAPQRLMAALDDALRLHLQI